MQKILVIEDDRAIAELIKLKLERSGFEVLAVLDGIEGLETLKENMFDLIILDILLPRMDGFQFYKKLKETPRIAHIPVLVMTGRGAMKDSFESLGVQSFLTKPFEPEDLIFQVKKLLAGAVKSSSAAKTALIAGTNPARLQEMKAQLEAKGYQVSLAADGHQALGKALQLLPDLFILQYSFSEISSDEIIKALDDCPAAKQVSVVVYSLIEPKEQTPHSQWGQFVLGGRGKKIRNKEKPIEIDNTFDSKSFMDKIKDFI
ncbi:MAG: response regulator [Candidatus Omnitrophota bacterium]